MTKNVVQYRLNHPDINLQAHISVFLCRTLYTHSSPFIIDGKIKGPLRRIFIMPAYTFNEIETE